MLDQFSIGNRNMVKDRRKNLIIQNIINGIIIGVTKGGCFGSLVPLSSKLATQKKKKIVKNVI